MTKVTKEVEKVEEVCAQTKATDAAVDAVMNCEEMVGLKKQLGFLARKLEQYFGKDFNGDGKIGSVKIGLLASICVLVVAFSALAGDITHKFNVDEFSTGRDVLYVDANYNTFIDGDLTVSSNQTVTGNLTVSGAVIGTGSSQTVTNGQEITLVAGRNIITPSGLASGFTNVVTLADATDNYNYDIVVASTATNVLGIADSGNVSLTAAFNGSANDYLALLGYSTNYVETGRSDN